MSDLATLLSALLLGSVPQGGETRTVSATLGETKAQAEDANDELDDDKIICRRTAIVGSKFKKRICGTKEQWRTLENRSKATTQEFQRRGKGLEPNDTGQPNG